MFRKDIIISLMAINLIIEAMEISHSLQMV